jgi:hypothetical protein
MNDQLAGSLRALVPALVAYLVGRGFIPAGVAAEAGALILAAGAVGWSIFDKRRAAKVASVAAMPGTVVSADGKTITIVDRDLAVAAKDAATPVSGA